MMVKRWEGKSKFYDAKKWNKNTTI
jgi:hypothetical protein